MKVVIVGDMEGVAGIVHWDQISAGEALYAEGRRMYTEELNAAARGAFAAGATEVLVIDSHGSGVAASMKGAAFNSLLPEALHPDVEFVTHHGWGNFAEFFRGMDALLLVGAHARGGTPGGTLSHTISSQHWWNIYVNGTVVGEVALLAAQAGAFGVPVCLVTGDDKTIAEARAALGEGFVGVQTKRGLGRYSARSITPVRARERIEAGAREALAPARRAQCRPFVPARPTEVRFQIVTADLVDTYRHRPGVEIEEPQTVVARGDDFLQAWSRVAPYR